MIPDDEYPKLLRAVRISGSILLLNSAWAAFTGAHRIPLWAEVWENMFAGGISSLDGSLGFLVKCKAALTPAVLILTLAGTILIWRLRRLSSAVLAAGLGVAMLSGFAHWMDGENFSGFHKLVSNFQGV